MVDDCPASSSSSLASRCKPASTNTSTSYHSDLPVHDPTTNVTYSNVFCALCHGVSLADVAPVAAAVVCNNRDLIEACRVDVVEDVLKHQVENAEEASFITKCLSFTELKILFR